MTIWGRVGRASASYFYVDDGSSFADGTTTDGQPNIGIRVEFSPGALTEGDYVLATGISECLDGTSGVKIVPRSAGDIVKVSGPGE